MERLDTVLERLGVVLTRLEPSKMHLEASKAPLGAVLDHLEESCGVLIAFWKAVGPALKRVAGILDAS